MRAPRTLSAAIKRLEDAEWRLRDLEQQVEHAREWGAREAAEVGRLSRIMTYRWNVNDGRASCPHAEFEVGKISGTAWCKACGEPLDRAERDVFRYAQKEASNV